MTQVSFAGDHILVVEDNYLIGWQISTMLEDAGAGSVSLAGTKDDAFKVIEGSRPNVVLLDLRLDGLSIDIADRLNSLDIPFAFVTGNPLDIPARLCDHPVCTKPFTASDLSVALIRAKQMQLPSFH